MTKKPAPARPWWRDVIWPSAFTDDNEIGESVCEVALVERALAGLGRPVQRFHATGVLTTTPDAVFRAVAELGGRLFAQRIASPLVTSELESRLFAWPAGTCEVRVTPSGGRVGISCVAADPELVERLVALVKQHVGTPPRAGRVFALVQGTMGHQLTSLGVAAIPLERDNYEPAVLDAFDHVVGDLATSAPCGRLALFDGAPGTGKSFLVRGLLSAQRSDAMFVVVPPDLVRALAGPTLLPTLLEARHDACESGMTGPIVLVLEDADECLAPRMADNIATVAAMLAFCDGIVGHVIDLRVVATTNRPRFELDEALLRPGRLCRRVTVGPLPPTKARTIFERLVAREAHADRADWLARPRSLAEIYAAARDAGWQAPPAPVSERGAGRGVDFDRRFGLPF